MNPYLIVFLLTFIPWLEQRYSIPIGILSGSITLPFGFTLQAYGLPWWWVLLVAASANIIVGVIAYIVIDKAVHLLFFWRGFERFWHRRIEKTQKRIRGYVERYGLLGMSLFIAIPLPGSGVYTGAIGSYALGLGFRKFFIANVIGVLLSAMIITLITLGVGSL
ncbi:hypothetical protein DRJ17_01910 [Candidatus Woesearchaeota archaeon]|nr:MAG: hypothetical protein DRJ17_01910 [Candidatus Woesearchaeota archaeon]